MKRGIHALLIITLGGIATPALAVAQAEEARQHLAKFAGSYIATVWTWDDPDAEPVETTLLSEQRMIMDGRFLQVDEKNEEGTYHWRAVHGFDATRGYIMSVGITNQLDMVSVAKTRFDENGRWILIGEFDQVPTYKGVATLTEDGYTYVNYRLGPDGEELGKYREIVYRRRN